MPDRKPKSGPVSQGKPFSELSTQQQMVVDLHCSGMTELDAYRAAGCKGVSRGAASRYFSRLRRAIEERRAPAIRKAAFTIEEYHARAAALNRFDPLLVEDWIKGRKTLADMTPEERVGFVALKVGAQGVSARAIDPLRALALIGPSLGVATERVEHVDADAARAKLEEALSRRRKAGDAGD